MNSSEPTPWNKLFKFEWKKDIPWILFFLLLFFTAWGYYRDKELCSEISRNPCAYCVLNETNWDMIEQQGMELRCDWIGRTDAIEDALPGWEGYKNLTE